MDFLRFVITAVLSSALVSAVLFAIINHLTPRVRETNAEIDAESAMSQVEAAMSRAEAARIDALLKLSERDRKRRKIAV
jgi:CHASE3 domain sensor protein